MPQTLVKMYVHIVFSTKDRENTVLPEIEKELFSFMGGTIRNYKSVLLAANGTANHVHLLVSLSKNISLSDLLRELKKSSSAWIKTKDIVLKNSVGKPVTARFQSVNRNFHWSKIILLSRKNITKQKFLKMNTENFCKDTKLISTKDIF